MEQHDWETQDGENVLGLENSLENKLRNVKRGRLVIDKNDSETSFLIDSFVENYQRNIKLNPHSKLTADQQVYQALSRGNNADYNVVVVNNTLFETNEQGQPISANADYDLHQVYQN